MMSGTKAPWQSLTVMAAAASLLVSVAGALGVAIDPTLAAQAVDGIGQIVSAIAAGVAIYGRIRASRRIARRE